MAPLTLEEQTFLDDPLAIEACLSCGIELHELHTQTLSLSSHGHDIASMAEHAEKRRQMKWKLVREEHARLQRRQPAMASSASAGGLDTARMERLRKSQASNARMMLERQSRLMRQEMEAEARKERMELKQKMATANRESQQLLCVRELLVVIDESHDATTAREAELLDGILRKFVAGGEHDGVARARRRIEA